MSPTAYSGHEVRAMRRFILFILSLTAIVVPASRCRTAISTPTAAQAGPAGNWQNGNCEDRKRPPGESHACQMRHTTFALPSGHMSVETTNGGIDVIGEDRSTWRWKHGCRRGRLLSRRRTNC